jgi:Bacterial Ig-like domain
VAMFPCCGGGLSAMTGPVSGSVRIGTYALEVGTSTWSYAAFEPEREDQNVTALHDALAEDARDVRLPVAALENIQANAERVTSKCERAHELSRAAAEGSLLEADAVMAEVDSLIRLAERLDRDGRFDEELRLLRALHGLLVLVRRWVDLIRVLRRALSAAEETGDLAALAWTRHEIGSLQLCADDPQAAEEQLGQALRLQQRLGQTAGTCATRHNLDSAQRDLATRAPIKPWSRRRLPRLAVVASAFTLLAVGGTGMALALSDSRSPTTPTTTPPTTGTSETTDTTTTPTTTVTTITPTTTGTTETTDTTTTPTTGTTVPVDVIAPDVAFDTPSDNSVVRARIQGISGKAGVEPGDAAEVLVEIVAIDENGVELVDESGAPLGASLSAQVVDGAWTVTETVVLGDGSYEATATQSDDAGNVGSSRVTFRVDTGGVD